MRETTFRLSSALLVIMVVAGCGPIDQVSRPSAQGVGHPSAHAPAQTSLSAAEYLNRAGSLDLFEIRSSEIAQQRSSNRSIRDFAQAMVEEHKGTSAQLSFAGRRLNLLPRAELRAEHQIMLETLQASRKFDQTYRDQQQSVHVAAMNLHGDYAERGTSPTLRPVAASAAAVERRHWSMLNSIR